MSIQFNQEDGTGLDDSTSYVSSAEYTQYLENYGYTSNKTGDEILQLLNRSQLLINERYWFKGEIVKNTQALDWPRHRCYTKNNVSIASDEIPKALKDAQCSIAYQIDLADEAEGEITNPNAEKEGYQSQSLGPMSITYGNNSSSNDRGISYNTADTLLKPFTDNTYRV